MLRLQNYDSNALLGLKSIAKSVDILLNDFDEVHGIDG